MITKPDETLIIECKSGYAGVVLAHEQVVHWLQEQVPNMYKTLAQSDNKEALPFNDKAFLSVNPNFIQNPHYCALH